MPSRANSTARSAKNPRRGAASTTATPKIARFPRRARQIPLPRQIDPQLATLTKSAPPGDEWLHEIKFDGYRMLCRIDGGSVQFRSRNQLSWTDDLQHLVTAAKGLPVRQAFLDGEVVALGRDGITDFQALQNVFRRDQVANVVYYAFDLLYLDGFDLRDVPLESRKAILGRVLRGFGRGSIRYTDHVVGNGPQVFREAAKMKLEGIISKRRMGEYVSGRSSDWLKVKALQQEEFVIGGYTAPGGSRSGFGSLLVGFYQPDGRLFYAGRVGTGFDERWLAELKGRLSRIEQPTSPFLNLRGRTGVARNVTWVKPKLVCQVAFTSWTEDSHLRHPTFLGMREDKSARQVVRE